ncbi:MAG: uroporphyrinogen decarboxylase family protein [Promethearchaeati archaeon]
MKSEERVRRAFHFENPDRVPMSCLSLKTDFFPVSIYPLRSWQPTNYPPHVQGGVDSIQKLSYRIFTYRWKRKFRKKAGHERKFWKKPHISIDEWEIQWKSSGSESNDITRGHPHFGPLQDNWDYLKDFEPPDISIEERYNFLKSGILKLLGKNRYTLGELAPNGFFNLCSQIRGFSNFLIDIVRRPNKVHQLIEKLLPYFTNLIENYKKFYPPLNAVIVADDLGSQKSPFISPEIFKTFFKEPYKKIIDLAHDLGLDFIMHSCGQIYEVMPDIIEIGVDVFEFDSPHMVGVDNFKKWAEERKVAFWLSSNIQTTFSLGTPEEVEEEIKTYIRKVGNNDGGLAVYEYMPSSTLRAPKENVMAQRKVTLKWGQYNEDGKINWLI